VQLQSSQVGKALGRLGINELGKWADVGMAVGLGKQCDGVSLGQDAVLLVLEGHRGRDLVDGGFEVPVGLVH